MIQFVEIKIIRYPAGHISPIGERIITKIINLPREVLARRKWYTTWCVAIEQCKFPKHYVTLVHVFYTPGDELTPEQKLKQEISSAKAQVTKIENAILEHKRWATQQSLFYEPERDVQLNKAEKKLLEKKSKLLMLQNKESGLDPTL